MTCPLSNSLINLSCDESERIEERPLHIEDLPEDLCKKIFNLCSRRDYSEVSKRWNKVFRSSQTKISLDSHSKCTENFAKRFANLQTIICKSPNLEQLETIKRNAFNPNTELFLTDTWKIQHSTLTTTQLKRPFRNGDILNQMNPISFYCAAIDHGLELVSADTKIEDQTDAISADANRCFLEYIHSSPESREDPNILLEYFKFVHSQRQWLSLLEMGDDLRKNREFMLNVIEVNHHAIKLAHNDLKNDATFIHQANRRNRRIEGLSKDLTYRDLVLIS